MVTALIADDEPLARQRLRDLIADVDWIECVGEAADGNATLTAIDSLEPDLAFLDIRMPGMSAFEALKRARHKPAVIFTTAYDRYAVTAFELHALDYLLKPFGPERFKAALGRVRAMIGEGALPAIDERAASALSTSGPLTRIFVRGRGQIIPVAVKDITRLEARDDYVAVHAGGQRHLVHITLNALEARLDPERFLRIHRSHVVNLDWVQTMVPHDAVRLEVRLKDGTKLLASRSRSRAIREIAM